ncbi:hypothetical protein BC827DRAFT_237617 [Russula dissimulans]|nr:hypothetical protein BC827DRAFT_237617 [Russula dissimulans]
MYNIFTFLQIMFYDQFKFFFNLSFLLVALSRFVPALGTGGVISFSEFVNHHHLRHDPASLVGFLVTYIAYLCSSLQWVKSLRRLRAQSRPRSQLCALPSADDDLSHGLLEDSLPPTGTVPSSSIRVSDLVLFEKN